jgi:putative ABC transport system permease protein
MIMSLLGVFAFSGLQATAPDMLNSLDHYLDDHNTYDIKITSTLGLSNSDIIELEKIEGIKEIIGSYSKDALVNINNEDIVISISSFSEKINTITLKEGNLPNSNEIVVEENMLKKNNLNIGDKISIDEVFYTISGSVDSSLYFNYCGVSQTRGTTSIGTGVIEYYSFVDTSFLIKIIITAFI